MVLWELLSTAYNNLETIFCAVSEWAFPFCLLLYSFAWGHCVTQRGWKILRPFLITEIISIKILLFNPRKRETEKESLGSKTQLSYCDAMVAKRYSQNHKMVWVGRDLIDHLPTPLPWAGTPSTRPGCSTQPWLLKSATAAKAMSLLVPLCYKLICLNINLLLKLMLVHISLSSP